MLQTMRGDRTHCASRQVYADRRLDEPGHIADLSYPDANNFPPGPN
jgi:hypothetical protein